MGPICLDIDSKSEILYDDRSFLTLIFCLPFASIVNCMYTWGNGEKSDNLVNLSSKSSCPFARVFDQNMLSNISYFNRYK